MPIHTKIDMGGQPVTAEKWLPTERTCKTKTELSFQPHDFRALTLLNPFSRRIGLRYFLSSLLVSDEVIMRKCEFSSLGCMNLDAFRVKLVN